MVKQVRNPCSPVTIYIVMLSTATKTKFTPSNGNVFSWVLYLMQSTQRSAEDFLLQSIKLLLSAFLLIQHLYEDENYTLFFLCCSTSFILIRENLHNTGLSCFPQKLFSCPPLQTPKNLNSLHPRHERISFLYSSKNSLNSYSSYLPCKPIWSLNFLK